MAINLGEIENENISNNFDIVEGLHLSKNKLPKFQDVSNTNKMKPNIVTSSKPSKSKKYKFGDITKAFVNEAGQGINNFFSLPGKAVDAGKDILNESEALKDGYQFGDITKTIGSTALSTTQLIGEGALRGIETGIDAGTNLLGSVSDKINTKLEKAVGLHNGKTEKEINAIKGQLRKETIAEDYTNKLMKAVGKNDDYKDFIESNSLIKTDNMGGAVAKELGRQTLNTVTAGYLGNNKILQSLPMLFGSYGGGVEEAYQDNATWDQANRYGVLNAVTETATEWVTGGIPGLRGTAGKGLDGLAEKFIGEGIDETSKSLSKALLKSGYKLTGEGTEEMLSEFINPYLKQFTYQYNSNKDILGNLGEATKKVNPQDMISSFIMGAITAGIIDAPNNISNIKKGFNNGKINNGKLNVSESLSNSTNLDDIVTSNINNHIDDKNVIEPIKMASNNILEDRYNYQQSKNSKINMLNESASQYFNNSKQSHQLVDTISKIVQDKGYNVLFDNNIKAENGNTVNAQIKTLPNGETEIRINPNSERAGEFLIMHEVTHAIETDAMKDLVLNYASRNEQFNESLESLKKTYGTNDVSSEILADISGQLFGNQEFINSLVMENTTESKNIIKKVYESIKRVLNNLTENGRYKNFVQDLEAKWREAYISQNNVIENTQYMMTGIKGTENAINQDNKNFWLMDNYNKSQELKKRGYLNEEIRQKTGWFQDKYKKWKFEIDDSSSKIIKKLEKNKQYRLEDILSHEDLYTMYPNLKYLKVTFGNISSSAAYYNKNKEIIINNNKLDISNYENNVKRSLLHEIQHAIQREEGFKHGTSTLFGKKQYVNNLGEIEATDTSKRGNLTIEKRIQMIPESSKKNPIHPNRDNILNKRTKIEKVGDKLYNTFRGGANENISYNQEQNKQNSKKNIYKGVGRTDRVELDNSSFKLSKINKETKVTNYSKQNDTWQKHLEKNYKSMGTKTDMNDIKIDSKVNDESDISNKTKNQVPIKEINKKKIENNAYAIKRLTQEKEQLINRLQNKIDEKQTLLKSKNNKDTKVATQLNIQISNLNNQLQNRKLDYEHKIEYYKNKNEKMNSEEFKILEQRISKKQDYIDQAYKMTENMIEWKDKNKGIFYQVNTMKRNLYDIMSKSEAEKIYNNYFLPVSENNAKAENFINSYNEQIKKLNLSEKEAIAVQMLGEIEYYGNQLETQVYKYNPLTKKKEWNRTKVRKYLYDFIAENNIDYNKVKKAVPTFRNVYDSLFVEMNKVLKEQGYKEIEYRKGYFPHFIEEKSITKFDKLKEKLGIKISSNESLPTDIAGITDTFKPGKTWFGNSLKRTGQISDMNAFKGLDNYIRGAADVIFHTEDIQKLRALEMVIRTQYLDESVTKEIEKINNNKDLSKDQKQDLIDAELAKVNNPLPNLVSEIKNYTDNLANKKALGDRGMEQMFGRETYTVMKNIQSRVSANMVGFNISSALTNFIPITQAWGEVSTKNMGRAIKESIINQFKDDGFTNCSAYLINRTKQADRLYKTKIDNWSSKAGVIFESIDSITSNTIVRGKYYDNIDKGMSQEQAIRNANEFAKDIMAGRSKGDMPTIFNRKSPLVKLFTAFQLEVNNQYGYMLKDLPRNLGDEARKKLIAAFTKIFIGAWLYNKFSESITGRKSAFSPIDIVAESVQTIQYQDSSTYDKISSITSNLISELPFVGGIMGGGKLPIQAALPDLGATIEAGTQLADREKRKKAILTLKKELTKPLFYIVPPFGGGQLKKTVEGASAYFHDVPGSYTSSGKLRFEVKKNPKSVIQNLIFGQYSSKEAREYFEKGYAPLSEKQIKEYKKLGVDLKTYQKYRYDLSSLNKIKGDKSKENKIISGSSSGKKAYQIMNSKDYSKKEKNYLLSKISTSKQKTTVDDLNELEHDENIYKYFFSLDFDKKQEFIKNIKENDFSSRELVDYYTTKKKYSEIYTSKKKKEAIQDYLIASNFTDKQKMYLYSKEYISDENQQLLEQFKIDDSNYLNTMKYITQLNSDYTGNNYSNYRKNHTISYINSLNASIPEKIILLKQAGYSISNYKNQMFQYVENLSLTKKEKLKIWNQLF